MLVLPLKSFLLLLLFWFGFFCVNFFLLEFIFILSILILKKNSIILRSKYPKSFDMKYIFLFSNFSSFSLNIFINSSFVIYGIFNKFIVFINVIINESSKVFFLLIISATTSSLLMTNSS